MKKLMKQQTDKKIQLRSNSINQRQPLTNVNDFERYIQFIHRRGQPIINTKKHYKCLRVNRKKQRRKKIILKFIH